VRRRECFVDFASFCCADTFAYSFGRQTGLAKHLLKHGETRTKAELKACWVPRELQSHPRPPSKRANPKAKPKGARTKVKSSHAPSLELRKHQPISIPQAYKFGTYNSDRFCLLSYTDAHVVQSQRRILSKHFPLPMCTCPLPLRLLCSHTKLKLFPSRPIPCCHSGKMFMKLRLPHLAPLRRSRPPPHFCHYRRRPVLCPQVLVPSGTTRTRRTARSPPYIRHLRRCPMLCPQLLAPLGATCARRTALHNSRRDSTLHRHYPGATSRWRRWNFFLRQLTTTVYYFKIL
jgi:hypothetical protein